MSLHINNQFAKKHGISKNLLLAVRTVLRQEQVDMVAGDFNGAAWRRRSGNDQRCDSIIEEAFANTNLPIPQGPQHCGDQVEFQENGPMCADSSSHPVPRLSGIFACTVRSKFLTKLLASNLPTSAATTKFGFINRRPNHVAIRVRTWQFTVPFPSVWPWHCVVHAPAPCCCLRESMPRRRLAHRARSRALGNLFINVSCGILAVALGCPILLFLSSLLWCTAWVHVIWSHPCARDCCFPLEGPHFCSESSWAHRNHVLLSCQQTSLSELGHQRCIPLDVSMMALALLVFLPFWPCSVFPLLDLLFGVRLRTFEFDGLLVLSWTIPPSAPLIWKSVKDMCCYLHFDDRAVLFLPVDKCPRLRTLASLLTLCTLSEMDALSSESLVTHAHTFLLFVLFLVGFFVNPQRLVLSCVETMARLYHHWKPFRSPMATDSRRPTWKNGNKRPMPSSTLVRNRSIDGRTPVLGRGTTRVHPRKRSSPAWHMNRATKVNAIADHIGLVGGVFSARGKDSSVGGVAVVICLGVVHMEEGVQVRVQVEVGREEVGDSEGNTEKDRTRTQATVNHPLTMDGMNMQCDAHQLWGVNCIRNMTCEVYLSRGLRSPWTPASPVILSRISTTAATTALSAHQFVAMNTCRWDAWSLVPLGVVSRTWKQAGGFTWHTCQYTMFLYTPLLLHSWPTWVGQQWSQARVSTWSLPDQTRRDMVTDLELNFDEMQTLMFHTVLSWSGKVGRQRGYLSALLVGTSPVATGWPLSGSTVVLAAESAWQRTW